MPVVRAAGKEGAKPELGLSEFVDVNGSQIAAAAGGDIEAETELGFTVDEGREVLLQESLDFFFATLRVIRIEVAELRDDLIVLEVHTGDFVVHGAVFDGERFD